MRNYLRLQMNKWNKAETQTPHDGDYLCFIEQVQECGNIWNYQRVIRNDFNTWVGLFDREVITHWQPLPEPPTNQTHKTMTHDQGEAAYYQAMGAEAEAEAMADAQARAESEIEQQEPMNDMKKEIKKRYESLWNDCESYDFCDGFKLGATTYASKLEALKAEHHEEIKALGGQVIALQKENEQMREYLTFIADRTNENKGHIWLSIEAVTHIEEILNSNHDGNNDKR